MPEAATACELNIPPIGHRLSSRLARAENGRVESCRGCGLGIRAGTRSGAGTGAGRGEITRSENVRSEKDGQLLLHRRDPGYPGPDRRERLPATARALQ